MVDGLAMAKRRFFPWFLTERRGVFESFVVEIVVEIVVVVDVLCWWLRGVIRLSSMQRIRQQCKAVLTVALANVSLFSIGVFPRSRAARGRGVQGGVR